MKSGILAVVFILSLVVSPALAQNTQIRGFADLVFAANEDRTTFGFGEWDLFITSQLNDRFSFLGETVFKYTPGSETQFSVGVERIIVKFNIAGNHNFLVGKHHTPLNYWNDTYHHGRVFFPTIFRPALFDAHIIPIHTTGISLRGQNLGNIRFGYDLMLGNGIGSSEVFDDNKAKSLTVAAHIKPIDGLRIGVSWYNDYIENDHHGAITWPVRQNLFTGSVSYFGDKFEILAEGTLGINKTDTTGAQQSLAWYAYGGYKVTEKIVPYIRVDQIAYDDGEIFFHNNDMTSFVGGIRYNINYLIALKFEYESRKSDEMGDVNLFSAQLAIGF
jgi:hypothetical protein